MRLCPLPGPTAHGDQTKHPKHWQGPLERVRDQDQPPTGPFGVTDPLELDGAQAHWPLEQPGVHKFKSKQAFLKTMGPPELDGALGQQAIIP